MKNYKRYVEMLNIRKTGQNEGEAINESETKA